MCVTEGVYTVTVTTAADSHPPHSAVATITVYGERGRSKETELSQEAAEVFQPGGTDEFEVSHRGVCQTGGTYQNLVNLVVKC